MAWNAVRELLSTEESYAKSLRQMNDFYYEPLRATQYRLSPILTENDINVIFGNVEDLLLIADGLLKKLSERIPTEGEGEVPKVGDIMCNFATPLKLYEKYVKHFERAAHFLAEKRESNKALEEFLLKTKQHTPSLFDLESYLIMPVQRIVRYKML
eukprot:CAMPEP_0181325790 /NCGR_PEP_ID=MMETSP1101-20121128/21130_1 /TAXON_ID=46948 /ORGANISM="Rhodomonas abbreviata, Strain Caron Lab Isolate" /LENGTH=155 /DNA_ID=CAMNT_0023434155 /DNA_START=190 /DNA_END=653 /DNA_ORIENTATION=+